MIGFTSHQHARHATKCQLTSPQTDWRESYILLAQGSGLNPEEGGRISRIPPLSVEKGERNRVCPNVQVIGKSIYCHWLVRRTSLRGGNFNGLSSTSLSPIPPIGSPRGRRLVDSATAPSGAPRIPRESRCVEMGWEPPVKQIPPLGERKVQHEVLAGTSSWRTPPDVKEPIHGQESNDF